MAAKMEFPFSHELPMTDHGPFPYLSNLGRGPRNREIAALVAPLRMGHAIWERPTTIAEHRLCGLPDCPFFFACLR